MTEASVPAATARELLRHAVAIVAYRGGKALRGAPPEFAHFVAGPTTRAPVKILSHTNDLYDWALTMAKGKAAWTDSIPQSWDAEVARFHRGLEEFDAYLAGDQPLAHSVEQLMAGPVADSLTHIGQINLLRRLAGAPVKGENYSRAEIVAGRVGPDQAAPHREFD
ncbi:MAG TPA: hypothetical protein VG916_00810 [Gemmatimonadaceae bacterium]|nr:hypothetical protein [Gemmatimonadaceae bacterium]